MEKANNNFIYKLCLFHNFKKNSAYNILVNIAVVFSIFSIFIYSSFLLSHFCNSSLFGLLTQYSIKEQVFYIIQFFFIVSAFYLFFICSVNYYYHFKHKKNKEVIVYKHFNESIKYPEELPKPKIPKLILITKTNNGLNKGDLAYLIKSKKQALYSFNTVACIDYNFSSILKKYGAESLRDFAYAQTANGFKHFEKYWTDDFTIKNINNSDYLIIDSLYDIDLETLEKHDLEMYEVKKAIKKAQKY